MYTKYCFKTGHVDDPKVMSLMAKAQMPYWITGYYCPTVGKIEGMYVMCYLPSDAELSDYWDDATEESSVVGYSEIPYSERYPKPSYIVDDEH